MTYETHFVEWRDPDVCRCWIPLDRHAYFDEWDRAACAAFYEYSELKRVTLVHEDGSRFQYRRVNK